RRHVVIAADMPASDEDLRHGAAAMRTLHHGRADLGIAGVDLLIAHALLLEQRLGGVTVGAPTGRIDLDLGHLILAESPPSIWDWQKSRQAFAGADAGEGD